MSLRLKLFVGISLFFIVALSFFGYMAYDAAKQSGTAREASLLQDLSIGLSRDLEADIGTRPGANAINKWLHEFNSLHLAIMVHYDKKLWLSKLAHQEIPQKVRHQIITVSGRGSMSSGQQNYVWYTSSIGNTSSTLTVIHDTNAMEAQMLFKRLTVPLIIAALIILWVAGWSTQYVAALLEKLNAQKDKLKHQATHDALTGLPNRSLMLDRLVSTMQEVDQSNSELALLFIDLNRFKEINDSLGHHYGDMLLMDLSSRLQQVLRKSDMVARLGGDEFAVILGHVTTQEAQLIAGKLNDVISQEIEIEGNKLHVSGSIGIARYPFHTTDIGTLLRYADLAMYAAKRAGDGYVFYEPDLDAVQVTTG
jgi:diguanylate cyclase (GGDEF)-like protein